MAAKVSLLSGVLYTDRMDFYPSPQQYSELYANVTPFLSGAQARYSEDPIMLPAPDFKFFEHRAGWRYQYFDHNDSSPPAWDTGGIPNDTLATTVTVDGVTGFTMGDHMIGSQVEVWDSTLATYKGTCIVTAVTSATNVTMKAVSNPSSSTFAVASLADNDRFYVIGSAFGEETEAPEAGSDELELVFNSCHLERTTIEIGQTLAQMALRGDRDELKRLRNLRANEHKIKQARTFYWGTRPGGIGGVAHGAGGGTDSTFVNHVTDANSKTVRTTMGIFPALRRYGRTSGNQQNVFSYAKAAMTYNDFVDIMEKVFQYSPDGGVKEMYAGPGFLTFLAKAGTEGLVTRLSGTRVNLSMTDAGESQLGLNITMLKTPHGELRVIRDELLRGTPYADHALVIDPANARFVRYEQDKWLTNIKQDNNPRVIKDELTSFCGIKMGLMESHSWIQLT